MTLHRAYFPLDELAQPHRLPFGELLDELLQHIWITNPAFDPETQEGVIGVLVDQAVEAPVPGVPALTLALGDQQGGVNAEVRIRVSPTPSVTAELPLTLRIDGSVLRPLKPGTDESDPDRKTLDITLGSVRVGYDADGGFILDLPGGFSLPRCMIGTSGVILSASNVRWLRPGAAERPSGVSEKFTGLFVDGATIELSGLPIAAGTITMDDVCLGTGGFSGSVTWSQEVSWDGTGFHGLAAGDLFGFSGALTKVDLSFRQSALIGCEVRGDVFIPYLDRRIGLELAIDGRGGFSAAAGLPSSSPPEPGIGPGKAPGALLHLDLDVLSLDLDELRFTTGPAPAVSLSGRAKLDIAAIDSPAYSFRALTIDAVGRVAIDGGWLDVDKAKPATIQGFAVEVTRIGFGADPGGRMWCALNGGVKLAEGLPTGASVEGLKVSWLPGPDRAAVLASAAVSLEGVGVDLEVPGAFRLAGSVALFQDDPDFGHGFTGRIRLKLVPVKVELDAQLMIGRSRDGVAYVFVYLGVDLPAGIPLFATGASIYGFAGLVAINLRPDRRAEESWWHGWYKREPRGVLDPRSKWRVEGGAIAVGLGTTIGTAPDDGFAFNVSVLLMLALPGPVILLHGKGSFLTKRASLRDSGGGLFEALVVLDVPAKLFSVNLAAAYAKKNLLELRGEADAAFSWAAIPPPDTWHFYLGEKSPVEKRIRGFLLGLLQIDTYFQLHASGVALGGRIAFDGDWRFGPVHAWAHASLAIDAALSWRPEQFTGSLHLHGDAGIEAFGAKVAVILDAQVTASGPDPWYIGLTLHLEIIIDLWFLHIHLNAELPLEWGRADLPLPAPATPVVASVGARHPKVAEDVLVLHGSTIPPDARPTVTFTRPVLDKGMIGTPNTGALDPDTVGPRSFTYLLGHIALAAGSGEERKLIGAAGILHVTEGQVRLPVGLSLPEVAETFLDLLAGPVPAPVTLPVTGRTASGLAVTGSIPDGEYAYRLRPAPPRAETQITAVAPTPLRTAELTLAAGVSAGIFDGGTLALGGESWSVLAAGDTTITVATPGAIPAPGAGQLTGPPAPEIRGSWLPVRDRPTADTPGPTTALVLWARTPYTWFRGCDTETYDGFDLHNPDYACGPEPTEEPICAGFGDLPAGPLTGAFRTELLYGEATGTVAVVGSAADPTDRFLAIGRPTGSSGAYGAVELRFDPPVDKVMVHCLTQEGGTVSILRDGTAIASSPIPRDRGPIALTGPLDTLRVEGSFVTLTSVCFTPGWTCVPFEEASFPQGGTGEQTYAGLILTSFAPMRVIGDELRVPPAAPSPDSIPPGGGPMAVVEVRLPQPVTRIRFRVSTDCLVQITGNGQEVLTTQATAGQTIAVIARQGVIDRYVLLSQAPIGMMGPCFDAGPFGWRRQEQWTWQQSMRMATETFSRTDPVLAPGPYTLSVLTAVEITGAEPGTMWDDQVDTVFTVGPPPGLTIPTGDADTDLRYPAGGPLAELTPYVDYTVPGAGERPVYRSYDVGIAFTEPYVGRMFLAAGKHTTIAITDPNGIDRRSGAPNVWGGGPEVRLGEQETRFIKTLHGDGSAVCAPVDLTTIVWNHGVSSGAGQLMAPAAQHTAELRAAGHDRPIHRFTFTTSRFADFRHHLACTDGRIRQHTAAGTGHADLDALTARLRTAQANLTAALTAYATARTEATTAVPSSAQLDAYPAAEQRLQAARAALAQVRADGFTALWDMAFTTPPPANLPDGFELTHVRGLGPMEAVLLESAEPLLWERTEVIGLAVASATPLRTSTLTAVSAGAPDRGSFRWDGVDARTDVELRTHLGTLAPRVPGAWTLDLAVLGALRVSAQVRLSSGGSATLTGSGVGTGPDDTAGPAAATVILTVTGMPLRGVRLTGTAMELLEIKVERPFEPGSASGPLRLAGGVLSAPHSIDVTAYADTDLSGHRITWSDALAPSAEVIFHTFTEGTTLQDGRIARVCGGTETTAPDVGVDLYAGGSAEILPTTGVIFRLRAPNGRLLHERCSLPETAFSAQSIPLDIVASADQTRAFLFTGGLLPSGFTRLQLRRLRDTGSDLPRLSVGAAADPESVALCFYSGDRPAA
ncbi:hypothetical protein [Herbidospora mongoliensis]|uniref:hypothetical protein n=1 Tax=Herbidospora mongoliensis TaxID=688067 RepID=UPI000830AD75|nr:hypothetical protein [Herbidospora mongoliensis]